MTYTEKTKKEGLKVYGDSTTLFLIVANYEMPEYLELFKFPAKAMTKELSTLLFGRDSVDSQLKITKTVKKSLDRFYNKYKASDFILFSDLETLATANNVNFGIAAEMYLETLGYIKTDAKTDKENKIDIIKGNSKVQVKCAVIRDFSKKAYSMVNGKAK